MKNGLRTRKVRTKQSFLCKSCNKQFVEPDGFERMRYMPENITRAAHIHNDGFSLFETQYHLRQHDDIRVSRETIRLWHKKYSLFFWLNSSKSKTKT